jgi:hypothetical protein
MADETVTHRDLAAFHVFEMGRILDPELPEWDSDAAGPHRTSCRYIINLAHRRTIGSCVSVAIEKIAEKLASADGETWPDCNRAIKPELPELSRLAIAASRRQRYRHLARIAHAAAMNYYELGTDDEAYRQTLLTDAHVTHQHDKQLLATMRASIGVSLTPKDTE